MNCPKCNAPVGENEKFCSNCGALIEAPAAEEIAAAQPAPAPEAQPAPAAPAAPVAPAAPEQPAYQQPYQEPYFAPNLTQDYTEPYKPMSPWAYIGYTILFSIPIIGFILLLVFGFDKTYINRRNFARSFLIMIIIGVVLSILAIVAMVVLGFSLSDAVNEIDYLM